MVELFRASHLLARDLFVVIDVCEVRFDAVERLAALAKDTVEEGAAFVRQAMTFHVLDKVCLPGADVAGVAFLQALHR